ncbi:MATE family efflux transporter [Robertmurraya sp.]|jgi:multidrug resistance protein, MATE family|uniref:MATE family efflux transporter n=1 Tax=Robertmurraya sp. TaxID=2837525 RepID=UPI0037043BB0
MNLASVRQMVHRYSHTCTHREYFILAFPLILSGVSTPLLGVVDTAVVGRIQDPTALGGVAIAAVIFNTMYWLLGFLRVTTSGFTSQADGAKNEEGIMLALYRPMIIAILMGLIFILFQKPIIHLSLLLMGGNASTNALAETYFLIRIWGAPFILLSYVTIGWLVGLGKVKMSLFLQIGMNLLNIVLDIVFVLGLHMGVAGVAYATLIAEVSSVLVGMFIIYHTNKSRFFIPSYAALIKKDTLVQMFLVNRDHFLRTLCLVTMTGIFTSKGASMGELTLAANAILLQVQYVMAYLFGGFANASSILVGRAFGGKNSSLYFRALSLSATWGFATAILLSLLTFLFGDFIVSLFTTIHEVKNTTHGFLFWMFLFPLVGFWGLQLEGIFSGATDAKSVRNSIFIALLVFLAAIVFLVPVFGNHGVWLAFILFSLSRSVFLSLYVKKLTNRLVG